MSTLHVENLKGLSSGGNANKIIIPSGQTIDASAGTLLPSTDQIIQTKEERYTGTFSNISSTSFSTVVSVNITPKFSNSRILITTGGVLYKNNTGDGSNGAGFFVVHRDNSTTAHHTSFFEQGSNAANGHYTIYTSGNAAYHIYPHFWQMYDDPNTTSQVTYQFKIKSATGGNIGYYRGTSIRVQELKQ